MKELGVNIAGFFETVMMNDEEVNKSLAHNLKLDYKSAVHQLKSDFDTLFEDELETEVINLLKIIDGLSERLDTSKTEQIKFLFAFRKKVSSYIVIPKRNLVDYPKDIFKSAYAYQFFINSLLEFNVIDEYLKSLDKFQVVAKTMLDDEDYRNKVFVSNLTQRKYTFFLNKKFGTKINPDSMSKSHNHIDTVADYITQNFNPN